MVIATLDRVLFLMEKYKNKIDFYNPEKTKENEPPDFEEKIRNLGFIGKYHFFRLAKMVQNVTSQSDSDFKKFNHLRKGDYFRAIENYQIDAFLDKLTYALDTIRNPDICDDNEIKEAMQFCNLVFQENNDEKLKELYKETKEETIENLYDSAKCKKNYIDYIKNLKEFLDR